jgi:hypothetical protein
MKPNIPRSWLTLPKKEQKAIEEYVKQVAEKEVEREARIMLDLYMKMVCMVLHDAFGWGEKRLNYFLGNHRMMFKRQFKMVKDDTQIEYLNRRMAEIFKKDGFPKEFLDALLGEVVMVEPEV